MADRLNQSALPEDIICLRSTSGRDWRLRPVRPIAPAVQLVQDVAHPKAPPLTLKTVDCPSDEAVRLALDDVGVWRRALKADPQHILPLLDVSVHHLSIYFITPYCPGGDFTIQRSERAALRYAAMVAAAVEVIISAVHEPSHANLSPAHVLLDHAALPKVTGWGLSRARRMLASSRSALTPEQNDVRALAAILYSMLYGHRFDPDRISAMPDSPSISSSTQALLRDILIENCVPELTVFRYDLAAARGFVPPCGPALTPIVSNRREQILDSDLDSIRGLESQLASYPSKPSLVQNHSPPTPISDAEQSPSDKPILASSNAEPPSVARVFSMESLADASIADTVRAVTSGDLSVPHDGLIEKLINACVTSDSAPKQIFEVLFKLPISKHPILAFKVVTLLHRFLAEGSAKLTTQSKENDGFLSWIESSWTRERIQNKSGRVHMYTYCFAAGEIAWYTSLIRKRYRLHSDYPQTFTTHWMVRSGGSAALDLKRSNAFRAVVEIIEQCSSVLRKVSTSRDPVSEIKRMAVPVLVTELSKTYTIMCWIFWTSDEDSQADMRGELEAAHNSARSSLMSVLSDDELVKTCHPAALFDLKEEVSTSFDERELISVLKRFRKKKKRKTSPHEPSSLKQFEESHENAADASPETLGDSEGIDTSPPKSIASAIDIESLERKGSFVNDRQSRKFGRKALDNVVGDDKRRVEEVRRITEQPMNTDVMRNSRFEPNGRAQGFFRESRHEESHQDHAHEWSGRHLSTPEGRVTAPVNGLKKLSVSVRKGHIRNGLNPESRHEGVMERWGYDKGTGNGRPDPFPVRDEPDRETNCRYKERRNPSDEDEEWISDDGNNRRNQRTGSARNERAGGRRLNERVLRKKSTSETDSDDASKTDDATEERNEKRKSRTGRKASSRSVGSGNGGVSKRKDSGKVLGNKKHSNEKEIPFDKSPPKAKKKGTVNDNHSGGSREALAAAAQGRKTPSMNPEFEIAPYEVQYGPQIGSGGFGVVYKAKFRDKTVAVKKIHAHALSNAASVTEFQSEVAVLCTLRHPNILRFVGACTKPPNLMIVTEFMSRGTLFEMLHQSQAQVTWPMRKKFALDTCRGMRYLHDSKLLHRDLKSSNLMLDKDLNCKVGDFGLTRISKGSAAVQMTGQCGTFQYMAVEVLASKPYSEKADVFSFGILLWEMVARKLPYFGMQPMQVGIAVLQQDLRPTIPPKTPLPLSNMMRACWDSDPTRRPSFAQLVEALEKMPE